MEININTKSIKSLVCLFNNKEVSLSLENGEIKDIDVKPIVEKDSAVVEDTLKEMGYLRPVIEYLTESNKQEPLKTNEQVILEKADKKAYHKLMSEQENKRLQETTQLYYNTESKKTIGDGM